MDNEMPICSGTHNCDSLSVSIVTQGHTIEEVVEAFECALRGAGYVFDGYFELEDDTLSITKDAKNPHLGSKASKRSRK